MPSLVRAVGESRADAPRKFRPYAAQPSAEDALKPRGGAMRNDFAIGQGELGDPNRLRVGELANAGDAEFPTEAGTLHAAER